MTFEELLRQMRGLRLEENRAAEADYCEVVIAKPQLEGLAAVLKEYFGAPLKPEGAQPTAEASLASAAYGGIRRDQTLYHRSGTSGQEVALLWPWGSGERVTVKIIRVGKAF